MTEGAIVSPDDDDDDDDEGDNVSGCIIFAAVVDMAMANNPASSAAVEVEALATTQGA